MNKLIKIIIVSLSFNYVSYSQDINDKQIIEYAIDNIEEFKDFLSYPNDANKRSDIVNIWKKHFSLTEVELLEKYLKNRL